MGWIYREECALCVAGAVVCTGMRSHLASRISEGTYMTYVCSIPSHRTLWYGCTTRQMIGRECQLRLALLITNTTAHHWCQRVAPNSRDAVLLDRSGSSLFDTPKADIQDACHTCPYTHACLVHANVSIFNASIEASQSVVWCE